MGQDISLKNYRTPEFWHPTAGLELPLLLNLGYEEPWWIPVILFLRSGGFLTLITSAKAENEKPCRR